MKTGKNLQQSIQLSVSQVNSLLNFLTGEKCNYTRFTTSLYDSEMLLNFVDEQGNCILFSVFCDHEFIIGFDLNLDCWREHTMFLTYEQVQHILNKIELEKQQFEFQIKNFIELISDDYFTIIGRFDSVIEFYSSNFPVVRITKCGNRIGVHTNSGVILLYECSFVRKTFFEGIDYHYLTILREEFKKFNLCA